MISFIGCEESNPMSYLTYFSQNLSQTISNLYNEVKLSSGNVKPTSIRTPKPINISF